jgi:hypothetical protein
VPPAVKLLAAIRARAALVADIIAAVIARLRSYGVGVGAVILLKAEPFVLAFCAMVVAS